MVEKDRKNGFLYTAACSAARMPPVYPAAAAAVFVLVFFRPEAFAVFPAAVLCVLFLSLCLVSAVCGGKNTRARFWQRVFCIPLCAGFAVGTLALFRIHLYALPPVSLAPPGHVERVLIRLRSDPVPWGESLFRAEGEALTFFAGGTEFPAEGRIALLIPPEIAKSALPGNTAAGHTRIPLALGSTLLCTGKFMASSFNGNSGGGDGPRGEPVRFVVSSVARQEAGNTFLAAVFRGRASLRLAMMKQIYAWGESGGFFLALASGMREFLDAGVNEIFRRAGLSHILALSGMHLAVLGGAVTAVCGKTGGKRFAVRVSLAAMVLFVFFAGFSPSLLRSLLFALAAAAVRRAGFRIRMLPVLAFVFLLHILLKPEDFYSLSFQLSYLATAGIFSAGIFFREVLDGVLPEKAVSALSVSLGAQAAVFPLSMSVFGMFAAAGIPAGLVLSFPSSFFLLSGIVCLFLSWLVPFFANFCGLFLHIQYEAICCVTAWFAGFPALHAGENTLPQPLLPCILLLLSVCAGFWILPAVRRRRMHGVDFSGL